MVPPCLSIPESVSRRARRQHICKIEHYPADAGRMAGQRKLTKQLGDVQPKRGGPHVISIADRGYPAKSAPRQVCTAANKRGGIVDQMELQGTSLLCSVEACNTQASSAIE